MKDCENHSLKNLLSTIPVIYVFLRYYYQCYYFTTINNALLGFIFVKKISPTSGNKVNLLIITITVFQLHFCLYRNLPGHFSLTKHHSGCTCKNRTFLQISEMSSSSLRLHVWDRYFLPHTNPQLMPQAVHSDQTLPLPEQIKAKNQPIIFGNYIHKMVSLKLYNPSMF